MQNLFQWQIQEFESRTLSRNFYIGCGIFLMATIAYALISNSPIMAITFILIGIMGFITLQREPLLLNCRITTDGVIVNKEIYTYENIRSFHLIIDDEAMLSLKTSGRIIPFVYIPFHSEDGESIHEALSQFLPEEEHEPTFIDTLGKMLHIR